MYPNFCVCLKLPIFTCTEYHAGPVEGARQAKRVVTPVSKNHHDCNGNLDSTAPSKSERLNSPNTASWEPDVRMLLSTSQWLKVSVLLPLIMIIHYTK